MQEAQITPTERLDFAIAMQAVAFAARMLGQFEWERLHAIMSDRDGTMAILDPSLFLATQRDRQWDSKLALVEAAANFTRTVERIKADVAKMEQESDG